MKSNPIPFCLKDGRRADIRFGAVFDEKTLKLYASLARNTTVTFANPDGSVWFEARVSGELVGVACLVTTTGRMKSAFVHPDYRSLGIYSQLYALRIQLARRLGLERLTTYTSSMSQPTFFKHGWRVIGKTKKALYMELRL